MVEDRWVLPETAGPPVLGKEAFVFKKTGLILAAFLCAINLYAVSFSVNGHEWISRSSSELSVLSCSLRSGVETLPAVSLDELFPAVYEAWRIELKIIGTDYPVRLSDPELGSNLAGIWLVETEGDWALLYKSRLFQNIESINIECELLEKDPLEIWINWEGISLLKQEILRYADLHDIDIKITEVPKPDSKLISVSQAGGTVPDIIMVQSSHIDRLAESASIQNLDYLFPSGMSQQARDAFSHSGKVWAVPFYYDAQMIFYNPEIIDTPDPDWNLADFEKTCLSAKDAGFIPSAWNSYSASFLIPFQLAFGKQRLIEADGSIIIDDVPTRQALKYVLELQQRGLMQPMERDAMTSLFVSGEAAMIISASYSIPHFQKLGIPFDAAPLPVNNSTGTRLSPLLDYKAFAITKRSGNSIGARRLIEYLCGTGVQQRFTSATAKLPALDSAWEASVTPNPWHKALSLSAEAGTVIPTEKAYSIYKNTMWKMLRFAISGKMPVEQILKKTQDLVNKNLEDRN